MGICFHKARVQDEGRVQGEALVQGEGRVQGERDQDRVLNVTDSPKYWRGRKLCYHLVGLPSAWGNRDLSYEYDTMNRDRRWFSPFDARNEIKEGELVGFMYNDSLSTPKTQTGSVVFHIGLKQLGFRTRLSPPLAVFNRDTWISTNGHYAKNNSIVCPGIRKVKCDKNRKVLYFALKNIEKHGKKFLPWVRRKDLLVWRVAASGKLRGW